MEVVLAVIAYSAIIAEVVLYARGRLGSCDQDCDQGRKCVCDDEWSVKWA